MEGEFDHQVRQAPGHWFTRATLLTATGVLIAPAVRAAVAFLAVPAGQPWRRACDRCVEPLRYPLASRAFAPPGRCPACGARVAAPGYVVEAALVLVVAALVTARRPPWEAAALGWWAVCSLVLAFTDLAVHRLPDRVTYAAAVGTIGMFGVAALVESRGHAWLRAVTAGVVSALLFAALTMLLGRRGPGLGDAKLMLSCVAVLGWLGWPVVVIGILACFAAQALCGIGLLAVRRADRSTFLPLAPFLVGATLASVAWLGCTFP